jgi:hypothetical protein
MHASATSATNLGGRLSLLSRFLKELLSLLAVDDLHTIGPLLRTAPKVEEHVVCLLLLIFALLAAPRLLATTLILLFPVVAVGVFLLAREHIRVERVVLLLVV